MLVWTYLYGNLLCHHIVVLGTSQIPLSDHNTPGPPHISSPQGDEDVLRRSWLLFDCILVSFVGEVVEVYSLGVFWIGSSPNQFSNSLIECLWRGLNEFCLELSYRIL